MLSRNHRHRITGSAGNTGNHSARSEQELLDEQLAVSGRYQRFERMLSQMADLLAKEDPEKES